MSDLDDRGLAQTIGDSLSQQLTRWGQQAAAGVARTSLGSAAAETGRVLSTGDGIAMVAGLPGLRLNELVRFAGGELGYALTLDRDQIGCVLLDHAEAIEAGQSVSGTGEVVQVPVGPSLLGRVIDPLGRPLDGGPAISGAPLLPAERPAPAIIDRDLVSEPVQTGVLALDALFPLGRGQRELIIGDRATGKTALATDAILAQKNSDMIAIYVAVGQKSASVARTIEAIRRYGAPERAIIVVAGPATPPGLQWLAPFAGFTMGEYIRDQGGHALVVVDDLSKHAATHRELALLTRQPPGREAYPGDVFYVHSRLLERAAKLSSAKGGGSLTALPVAETEAGNLSAYIPTNLISITDGQIVLSAKLFDQGQKPAVDTGLSVSRVGGKAQAKTLRKVVESLRLDYAQFLELEMFTRFGASVEPRVEAQIQHGQRVRAILSQPQYAPLSLFDEICLILAVQRRLFDPLALARMPAVKAALRQWAASPEGAEAASRLAQSGDLAPLEAEITALIARIAPQ